MSSSKFEFRPMGSFWYIGGIWFGDYRRSSVALCCRPLEDTHV